MRNLTTFAIIALTLSACSPAYYVASGKRCPPTTMIVSDLVLAGAALGLAGLHWSSGSFTRSIGEGSIGVGLYTFNIYAEGTCSKR
jgi:hypothetical protein